MCVCVCMHIYLHVSVCVHVCLHVFVSVCVCVCRFATRVEVRGQLAGVVLVLLWDLENSGVKLDIQYFMTELTGLAVMSPASVVQRLTLV